MATADALTIAQAPRPRPPARRFGSRARAQPIWSLSGLSRLQVAARVLLAGTVLNILLTSLVCVPLAVLWVGKPFPGFLVNERMVVGNVGQYHWTAIQAGLAYPDRVLEANGQPIRSMKDLDRVVAGVGVGDPVRYRVQRGGQILDLTIPTMRFTWADFVVNFGFTFVSGFVYLCIAIVVFVLKPDTEVSFAFALACFLLSVISVTSFDVVATHVGFVRTFMFANALFPAAFLHLSLVFPERIGIAHRHPFLRVAPYVVSAVLVVPYELLYPRPAFALFSQLVRVYAMLAAVCVVVSTVRAFVRSSSAIARQRAKIMLFGAALAFPLPALARYLAVVGSPTIGPAIQNNFLAIPVLIFPAAVAYAIARHNLFDVDVYIKRAVGYGIMTAIVGTAYVSMQAVLSTLVLDPVFGEYRDTVYPLVFALLVVFLFNPVNRRVQESVDKIFFRRQFDYKKTISAVSNLLTSMLNLDQIITQVIYTIRREMFVDTAGVIVLEPEKKVCRGFFLGDEPIDGDGVMPVPVAYDDPLLALVRNEKALITRYDIEEDPRFADIREACLRLFSEMRATLAIPLVYQGDVMGLLALGHKKSGHFYSREDVDLLSTMADQAAVAIENATTHEEVVRYAEELAASLRRIQILESIKTNLAKFVPKTVTELIEESPEAPSLDKREIDVSVLFADITGYTRLSAQMGLDKVNRIVERYFGAFLDEILSRGGDVNETAGDGLMVIFQKKDPRRHARAAVLAALGIQRRTREINAELQGQHEPITMKVGVNSGIAAVGATRIEGAAGTRWTYTASGPTTNVAARLAALAEGSGGGVIISEETRRRLGDEFRLEDLGPQSLKNVPEPVRAFGVVSREVPGVTARDARKEGVEAFRLYIVSRDRPDVYDDLTRRFEGAPAIRVILDRRMGQRRQGITAPGLERRRTDRRLRPNLDAELRSGSHVVVDVETEPDTPGLQAPRG